MWGADDTRSGSGATAVATEHTELTSPESARQHKPKTALHTLCSEAVPSLAGKDRVSMSKSSSDGTHGL